ncbi:hypothetical protein [Haloactinomyces albus]|uniref:Uncharacterized protein n=1 Tax=Haloactinomyces albus TaxID=1352928 RepID=A0AAE4CPX0_9ACTN|nr:hypothetical protein [Haloactinomyces albus]MDR7303522.1 hypothetical protein [Haloactinomyces albus]
MTDKPLVGPNLSPAHTSAVLDASEVSVRAQLHERFMELFEHPKARVAAETLDLLPLLDRDVDSCRTADLAVAIYRLETVLATSRAPLPELSLVDEDDAVRNPGFDDVEQEAFDEEEALLSARRSLA